MKKHLLSVVMLTFLLVSSSLHTQAQEILNLAGDWQFEMDRADVGVKEKWYNRILQDHIMLPGSMPEHDKGDRPTVHTQWVGSLYDSSFYFNPYMQKFRVEEDTRFPFFLTPRRHYVGAAWYRKQVYVPQSWQESRVLLFLERPHIETSVYVNGHHMGEQNSLSVPHEFDITDAIEPGKTNFIAIRVYNGIEGVGVGQDSHSVTDQTQGDWNGIVGRMELQQTPNRVWLKNVQVYPDTKKEKATIVVQMGGRPTMRGEWPQLHVVVKSPTGIKAVDEYFPYEGNKMEFLLNIEKMKLWDEFHPNLYHLTVSVDDEDFYETDFGMRNIRVEGRDILLNENPVWMRGTVENCTFPLTGYPPTEPEEWERIFRKCKEYGLNHMRFHSYCPPEAAFAAADHVGFYLQVEGPTWPNHGVKLGNGMTIDRYLMDETQRILDTYGNHPSFVMMASGNEPSGNWVKYTNKWVEKWKKEDNRRIYCGASVGGGWQWDNGSEYHVKGGGRGLDWGRHAPQSTDDYTQDILRPRNYKEKEDNNSPILAHEQGQWCAFPDLKERQLYTGVNKAGNFEIFADLLEKNGMSEQAEYFLMASGKLQTLCYKYEIERNLRTPGYAGFQLLGLNDYSGQGTALEGVLNVFWKEKGYCTAKEWRQFCSPVVPLAQFPKFVFSSADTLSVNIGLYNATTSHLQRITPTYAIRDAEGGTVIQGKLRKSTLPLGKTPDCGTVTLLLNRFTKPTKLTLTVGIDQYGENSWDFWVYPEHLPELDAADDIYVSDTLDVKALKVLQEGGKVLLTAAGKVTLGSDIRQTYLPVFWNTSWFKMRPPHTTGAYIDTKHPLFRHFPSDSWGNLNWWELLNRAQVMYLGDLPKDYQSPVQPIDTWHLSRKLGMMVEAQVLNGRLLMTTMDIKSQLNQRLVARQMRYAMLTYMLSNDFQPRLKLTPADIAAFYTKQTPTVDMHTNDSPDELKPKIQ